MDLSILIIEDEIHLLDVYEHFSKLHFAEVFCATNIQTAFNILENHDIHVILADNFLPGGRGIDFIKTINQQGNNRPVILLTGGANKELAIEAANCHVFNFLEKPVAYNVFKEVFNNIINHIHKHQTLDNVFNSYTLNQTTRNHLKTMLHISSREMEIIEQALQPYDNKTIGNILFISPGTVKRHLENIFFKLNISSRNELRTLVKKLNLQRIKHSNEHTVYKMAASSTTSKYPCGCTHAKQTCGACTPKCI